MLVFTNKVAPHFERHANINNDPYQRRSRVIQNEYLVLVEDLMFDRGIDDCFHAAFVLHRSMLILALQEGLMLVVT